MKLETMRISQKRIRMENRAEGTRYVLLTLPIHPEELDDLISYISGYDEFGKKEENVLSYYTLGNVEIDIRDENFKLLQLSALPPGYAYGKNHRVTKENGEIFSGRRVRGTSPKPMKLSRISQYLQLYFTANEELANHYAELIQEAWKVCYRKRYSFSFAYGIGRELFFLRTETDVEDSGILVRAEDDEFYEMKKEDDPSYPPCVEFLYGNFEDGYDTNLHDSYLDKEETLEILENNEFNVPVVRGNKLKQREE